MRFTYAYKTSDGKRHEAAMDAASREAVFETLRAQGIKAIKVVAADGSKANGAEAGEGGRPSTRAGAGENSKRTTARWVAATALVAAAIAGGAWWITARNGEREQPPAQITVNTPQGPVTYRIADPLPRQTIPGNRQRIEADRDAIFTNAAERLLSRFAEPGRVVGAPSGEKPAEAEFAACLRKPIRVASTDFTEVSDLKRIVAGLKREMRAYLAGGGTVEQYLSELTRRQKLEVSYRENAEKRLEGMLSKPKEAYGYWLKANAQLKSMGIYELPLPDALQGYQAGLDLNE